MVAKTTAKVRAHSLFDDSEVPLSLKNLRLFNSGAFSNVYRGTLESQSSSGSNDGNIEIVVKKTWGAKQEADKLNTEEILILKLLNRLNHKNIVRLLYTYSTQYPDNICYSLIFEFLPMNLYQYLKSQDRRLPLIEIKMFAWQLFRGLHHLERANIVHRDVKPQNLLVDPETGLLKIGDFGSSCIEASGPLHPYHVTRYYRPPELLLGAKHYGPLADVWSAGCVLSEMLGSRVTFTGKNTAHQLELIMSCFGLPSAEEVTAMRASNSKFRDAKHKFLTTNDKRIPLKKLVPISLNQCTKEAIELLAKVLVYNPNQRLHGVDLLLDPFFDELFEKAARRPDGRKIGCLGAEDKKAVERGDKSMTGSTEQTAE